MRVQYSHSRAWVSWRLAKDCVELIDFYEVWKKMTISERIFDRLRDLSMTQKEFSDKTSIRQSTISEWKKKHTNPSADKIMVICKVLGVTPEWLLSGVDIKEGYRNPIDWYIIEKDSEPGILVRAYNEMDLTSRARLMGYVEALRK